MTDAEDAREFDNFVHAETLPTPTPTLSPEVESRFAALEDQIQRLMYTARRQETMMQSMKMALEATPKLIEQLRETIAHDIAAKNLARDGLKP